MKKASLHANTSILDKRIHARGFSFTDTSKNKKLSYRRKTAMQGGLVMAKSGRL